MNSTREVFKYMDCSRFGGRHLDFTLKGTWGERGKIPVGPLSETRSGRLRASPHKEQAKRKRAWKSPHARKARRGSDMREKNDFSLPTASRLSRVGWISRALAFRPEKKWGLLVACRWGKMLVWQSRYLCLLNPQIPVFFYYYFSFFSGANLYITVNP